MASTLQQGSKGVGSSLFASVSMVSESNSVLPRFTFSLLKSISPSEIHNQHESDFRFCAPAMAFGSSGRTASHVAQICKARNDSAGTAACGRTAGSHHERQGSDSPRVRGGGDSDGLRTRRATTLAARVCKAAVAPAACMARRAAAATVRSSSAHPSRWDKVSGRRAPCFPIPIHIHFPIPLPKHGMQSIPPLISLSQPLFPTSQTPPN
uniref:Uncharacterized protein n=1 Tax=Setaria viridis TaxID=4556 RepID=A0A4U6VTR1_SETVI|nr:hypothetical protein SEVIR_2G094533v2 [Setaria viridis]